ncbi:hydrogenase maturation protease [Haloechinothrix halophila]|uniref:hydrogenase maturation protease n=1 Tax=Haloechinothrix halophila TaxID=1069073 RepID=UPI000427CAC0|nr:hydrogenase maturation protease [Haloechinothrix halophila]
MTVLVAGVGNVLRGDDGFGVVVAERLQAGAVPDQVKVVETGIGGLHLVQELMAGADALVVVDTVDLGREPGTVLVVRPEVTDVGSLPLLTRNDQLADVHYATPERAFMLASALGVLPEQTWVVGCQPVDANSVARELHPEVAAAVDDAIAEVRTLVRGLGVDWP